MCHPKVKAIIQSTCPTITVLCLMFGRKYHHFVKPLTHGEDASMASHVSNDHCSVDDRMLVHLMVAWLINYLRCPDLVIPLGPSPNN